MFHILFGSGILVFLLAARRGRKRLSPRARLKSIVGGLLVFNTALFVGAGMLLLDPTHIEAQNQVPETGAAAEAGAGGGWAKPVGAALAVGLGAIAAGIAVAVTGSAAIGGISQNPDIFGRTLVYVGLAEGIAIYGLIISFMILIGFGGG